MTAANLAGFAIGWLLLGVIGALWVFIALRDERRWSKRPAFTVAFLAALTGPLALAGVTVRALWRMSRTIAGGFGDLAEMRRRRRRLARARLLDEEQDRKEQAEEQELFREWKRERARERAAQVKP